MAKLNNPASRLHALLSNAKIGGEKYRGKPATEGWAMLLNVPTENQPLMLKRLGGVMELPLAIKTRIENLPDVDHKLFLRWLPKVEEAFRANHLAGGFHGFIDKIDETTLYGIEHCAALLSNRDPEAEIASEELEAIRLQVEEMINEMKDAEIDQALKNFLLRHLFAIRNAIDEYQVFGSKPLVTAFGEAIAAVYTEPQTAFKSASTPIGERFWKCVVKLQTLLTVGDKVLKITEGVFKLLQNPHEK